MCACGHPKSGRGSKGQGIVENLSVAPGAGAKGKQALAADKSPESGDDFTEVSRSRRTDGRFCCCLEILDIGA